MAATLSPGNLPRIVISDLQSALHHLEGANDALAAQLSILERAGKLDKHIAGQLMSVSGENFLRRTVTVWRGKEGFTTPAPNALAEGRPATVPDVVKANFSGFVIDQDRVECSLQ